MEIPEQRLLVLLAGPTVYVLYLCVCCSYHTSTLEHLSAPLRTSSYYKMQNVTPSLPLQTNTFHVWALRKTQNSCYETINASCALWCIRVLKLKQSKITPRSQLAFLHVHKLIKSELYCLLENGFIFCSSGAEQGTDPSWTALVLPAVVTVLS